MYSIEKQEKNTSESLKKHFQFSVTHCRLKTRICCQKMLNKKVVAFFADHNKKNPKYFSSLFKLITQIYIASILGKDKNTRKYN